MSNEIFVITAYQRRASPKRCVRLFLILTQTKLPFNNNDLKGPVAFEVNIYLS